MSTITVRSTQRAPKSCTACARRKVKCDKSVPCHQCLGRGEALHCKREVVRVRGNLVQAAGSGKVSRSYDELLHENAVLRALVADNGQVSGRRYSSQPSADLGTPTCRHSKVSRTEEVERRLFEEISRSSIPRTVSRIEDVILPSKDFSTTIVEHAFQWTFWLHFALFIPRFRQEHQDFWSRLSTASSLGEMSPSWLAVYFSVLASSLLFMDDNDTVGSRPQGVNFMSLLRNWYDSAVFFLDRADFMQNLDIRTPQAVTILGIVSNNVGDVHRHQSLWAVAIRQAQQLNLGSDVHNENETLLEQQTRRRLWWTLVLCDWLALPYRPFYIKDTDFSCQLPDEVDDEELSSAAGVTRLARSKPRPVRYHIAMAQVSKIYYRLQHLVHLREWTVAEVAQFVFDADEQLANLISDLPPYLQFDEVPTEMTRQRDLQYTFIPWQKKSLTEVLLYYRMAISRQLQDHWLDGSIHGARTRAICISSAQGLIHSTLAENLDASKLRPW